MHRDEVLFVLVTLALPLGDVSDVHHCNGTDTAAMDAALVPQTPVPNPPAHTQGLFCPLCSHNPALYPSTDPAVPGHRSQGCHRVPQGPLCHLVLGGTETHEALGRSSCCARSSAGGGLNATAGRAAIGSAWPHWWHPQPCGSPRQQGQGAALLHQDHPSAPSPETRSAQSAISCRYVNNSPGNYFMAKILVHANWPIKIDNFLPSPSKEDQYPEQQHLSGQAGRGSSCTPLCMGLPALGGSAGTTCVSRPAQ